MLYDAHIAVDWSGSNTPVRGKDSIWVSEDGEPAINIHTRAAAMHWVRKRIRQAQSDGERIHIGFDFAFGLPTGAVTALIGGQTWEDYWRHLSRKVEDNARNESNRFHVAGRLNDGVEADGPFWGHPSGDRHVYQGLSKYRCVKGKACIWPHLPDFSHHRHIDARVAGAQEVWKLSGAGSVGSQSILGIASLQDLRSDPEFADLVAIWPFETDFARDLSKPVLISEIYPTPHMMKGDPHLIADAQQVMRTSGDFYHIDASGQFGSWLEPCHAEAETRRDAIREEGWIVGR